MQNEVVDNLVIEKTKELCQTILDQPNFRHIRSQIEIFMADDQAKMQYQLVVQKGEALNQKQQFGTPMTQAEIDEFEQHRDAMAGNPVAQGFLDAQQEWHRLQESISQYVAKTFELGRVPSEGDFDSDSCGHGCGCH